MTKTELKILGEFLECLKAPTGLAGLRERILMGIGLSVGAMGVQLTEINSLRQSKPVEYWYCEDEVLPNHIRKHGIAWVHRHPYFLNQAAFDSKPGALLPFGETLGDLYYESDFFDAIHAQAGFPKSTGYGYLIPGPSKESLWGLALIFDSRRRSRTQIKGMREWAEASRTLGKVFAALTELESAWVLRGNAEQLEKAVGCLASTGNQKQMHASASGPSTTMGPEISATIHKPVLTEHEKWIARLVAEGLSNKEIAARADISFHTVRAHLRSVFAKLEIQSRSELILRAARLKEP